MVSIIWLGPFLDSLSATLGQSDTVKVSDTCRAKSHKPADYKGLKGSEGTIIGTGPAIDSHKK